MLILEFYFIGGWFNIQIIQNVKNESSRNEATALFDEMGEADFPRAVIGRYDSFQ